MKITIGGTLVNKKSTKNTLSRSIANLVDTINDSKRITNNDGENQSFNIGINFNKKYKKKGRSLNIKFNESSESKQNNGDLISENNYYHSSSTAYQKIDQLKKNVFTANNFSTNVSFTEPLNKKMWFAEVAFALSNSSQDNSMLSYNQAPTLLLDSIYSSNFHYQVLYQKLGFFIKANKKKFDLKIGSSFSKTILNQLNLFYNTKQKYPFNNIIPEGSFTWKINKQKDLTIRYNGRTNQPTLNQIQPIKDNSNPFNIIQGNPDLKQKFTQSISLRYNFYKVLSGTSLWSGIDYSTVKNDIIYSNAINEQGIRTGKYVNINGNYNASIYAYYGKELKKIFSQFGYNIRGNYYHANNYINSLLNLSQTYSLTNSLSYSFDKEKWPEFSIDYSPSYNYNVSSINKNVVTKYWQNDIQFSLVYLFKKRFEIGTDIDYTTRQKLNLNDKNNNFFIWNANVSCKVFKDRSGKLQFSVEDILKQRIGFNRYTSVGYINENYYSLITRYWMVKFIWNFTDKASKANKKDDDE
ncbi:MAG: outer membrane beta-barrel protein [Bacteroidetes bacterium]|nr:outer membrane beta-barrel protein [Bacteroidota bacterium]